MLLFIIFHTISLQNITNYYLYTGDYEKAYELYKAALTHWTSSAPIWANAAFALIKLGRNEEALRDARLSRTVDPKFLKGWYREGQAAAALEMWEDAAAAYFEAAQVDPDGHLADECERLVVECVKKGRAAVQAKEASKREVKK